MSAALALLLGHVATAAAAESIFLTAGPLSAVFDPHTASLRNICIGSHQVLSGINAPVRDQFWGTVPPVVSNLHHESSGDGFKLTFNVRCHQRDIDFVWKGEVRGRAPGELDFHFDGEARSTFLRNRIGFCILHGPEAAGKACVVTTADDQQIEGRFPSLIAPHQPFKNIRAIAHEVQPDVWAHLRCQGDIFEMEDQRNWTDASFKTYCTPLELPYPVRIEKGHRVSQNIHLEVRGEIAGLKARSERARQPVVLTLAAPKAGPKETLPRLGIRLPSRNAELSETQQVRLRALNLHHLRLDLTPARDDIDQRLQQAAEQADALGARLHLALHLGEQPRPELERVAKSVQTLRPPIHLCLVISADKPTLAMARAALGPVLGEAPIGTGEDTNFTELNRTRPDMAVTDVVSYGLNPQVHAFDDRSLIETLAIQADTVRTARQFVGELPLVISPITLKVQQENQPPLPGELPSSVDARQATLFTAVWTLGSVKYLAEAGADSATYFETVGWKGVLESESGSPLPQRFPSTAGGVFPVYHVLCDLGEFRGAAVRRVESTAPLSVVGLAIEQQGKTRLMVANLTDRPQRVSLRGVPEALRAWRLTAENIVAATNQPLRFRERPGADFAASKQSLALPAHTLARLDSP